MGVDVSNLAATLSNAPSLYTVGSSSSTLCLLEEGSSANCTSSSSLFSGLPSLAQKPLIVLPLSQKFQADPEYFHPAPVFAQKLHEVHDVLHDVHRFAQFFENVHDEISQILTYVSSKMNVSW